MTASRAFSLGYPPSRRRCKAESCLGWASASMRFRACSSLVVVATLLLSGHAMATPRACVEVGLIADQVTAEEAEAAFVEGNRLYGEGKLPEAITAYNEALRGVPDDARVLANRGMAKSAFGCRAQAANDLARAIALLKGAGTPVAEALSAQLEKLAGELGAVRLVVDAPGASPWMRVDEEALRMEHHPIETDHPIYAEPGRRVIVIQAEGFEPVRRTVELSAGKVVTLSVTLARRTASPAPMALPADDGDAVEEAAGFPWWPAAVSGAVAVVAGGVGGGLWAAAQGAEAEAAQLREGGVALTGDPSFCFSPASPEIAARCAQIKNELQSHDDLGNTAIGMWIGAGVAAALAGSLLAAHLLVEPEGEASGLRFEVVPGMDGRGNTGAVVRVRGTWW